jgi:hypothetical protein
MKLETLATIYDFSRNTRGTLAEHLKPLRGKEGQKGKEGTDEHGKRKGDVVQ